MNKDPDIKNVASIKKIGSDKPVKKSKAIYNYWQALYLSFYSNKLYLDVYKNWRGVAAIYLLLVIFIVTIPLSVKTLVNINNYLNEILYGTFSKLPTLYIQDGKISLNEPVPYFVKDDHGRKIVMIDTKNKHTGFPFEYPTLQFLITEDTILYRAPDMEDILYSSSKSTQSYDEKLRRSRNFKQTYQLEQAQTRPTMFKHTIEPNHNEIFIAKDWLNNLNIKSIKFLFFTIIYLAILFGFWSRILILLLIVAFMGQLIAKIFFNIKITYKEASKLLIMSFTPVAAIIMLLTAFGIGNPWINVIYLAVLIMYFCFAVIVVKYQKTEMVKL